MEGQVACSRCGAQIPQGGECPRCTEGWESVAEARRDYEAHLLSLRLLEAGIEARILDQSFRQEPVPDVRAMGLIRILVPKLQAEQARAVLSQGVALPEDIDFDDDNLKG